MANKYKTDSDLADLTDIGMNFGEDEDAGKFTYDKLTEEQLKLCKDCFEFFDKDKSGAIDRSELITVMRATGLNPSQKDVNKLITEVAGKGNKNISWPVLKEIICEHDVQFLRNRSILDIGVASV
ncbi:uncharacterized protein LOC134278357 [Saccostrea cucullata]|uniref:uncharacterized protein LOC134278357 n=1 Tax=Saccostrea cuccullata TaxID=36930 RepID=UPI002ED2AB5A